MIALEIAFGPRRCRVEKVAGIKVGVAQKFKSAAVKAVSAGFGSDVDLTAAVVAIFRVKIIGDDAKFRDGIQIGQNAGTIVPAFLHVRAVYHESVGAFALSVYGLIAGILIAGWGAIICVRSLGPVRGRNDAWLK